MKSEDPHQSTATSLTDIGDHSSRQTPLLLPLPDKQQSPPHQPHYSSSPAAQTTPSTTASFLWDVSNSSPSSNCSIPSIPSLERLNRAVRQAHFSQGIHSECGSTGGCSLGLPFSSRTPSPRESFELRRTVSDNFDGTQCLTGNNFTSSSCDFSTSLFSFIQHSNFNQHQHHPTTLTRTKSDSDLQISHSPRRSPKFTSFHPTHYRKSQHPLLDDESMSESSMSSSPPPCSGSFMPTAPPHTPLQPQRRSASKQRPPSTCSTQSRSFATDLPHYCDSPQHQTVELPSISDPTHREQEEREAFIKDKQLNRTPLFSLLWDSVFFNRWSSWRGQPSDVAAPSEPYDSTLQSGIGESPCCSRSSTSSTLLMPRLSTSSSTRRRRSIDDPIAKRPTPQELAELVSPMSSSLLPHWSEILEQWNEFKNKATLRVALSTARRDRILLSRYPITTLRHFFNATFQLIQIMFLYCASHRYTRYILLPIIASLTILHFIPGPHQFLLSSLFFNIAFAGWWIGLGVLSSVGLGCGLHSGVLFLFPFIYSICLSAERCNSVNFDPRVSMWSNQAAPGHIFECYPTSSGSATSEPDFLRLLYKCLPAALLWGLGTSIGELPPYAASYAAAQARQDDFEEFDAELSTTVESGGSFFRRPKQFFLHSMLHLIQRRGAVAVFLLSSWPNALFDVCGIMCGHFMMPFWRFFIALLLGKGVVKVLMQVSLLVFVFAERFDKKRAHLITLVAEIPPFSSIVNSRFGGPTQFEEFVVYEIQKLRRSAAAAASASLKGRSVVPIVLGIAVSAFMIYFLLTLVEQVAQSRVRGFDDKLLALANLSPTEKEECEHEELNAPLEQCDG